MIRIACIFIGLFLFYPYLVWAQFSSDDEKKMDSVCQAFREQFQIPGLSVGILKKDQTLYAKGFGYRHLDTKEKVDIHSLFHLASVSKPFTSTAILQLWEAKKLNLDSPVTKYLPYFKMKDARYKDITVRQLLLHSSGIPDVGGSENYHWDQPEYDDQALERYVKSLATKKLDFRPGKKYSYSNTGYNVLGDIIAKVSGKSYEAYIRESIYQPNDMQESTCERKTVPDQLAVAPHIQDKNKEVQVSSVYPYNRAHTPCSCLHSNVVDLLKWAQTQLNQGMYKGQQILGPEAYRRLSEGQIKKNKVIQASMGWDSGPLKGKTRYEFSGRDVGFQTYVLFVPEVDFALVFLSNGDFSPPAFDILLMAYDLALPY